VPTKHNISVNDLLRHLGVSNQQVEESAAAARRNRAQPASVAGRDPEQAAQQSSVV